MKAKRFEWDPRQRWERGICERFWGVPLTLAPFFVGTFIVVIPEGVPEYLRVIGASMVFASGYIIGHVGGREYLVAEANGEDVS